MTLRRLLHVTVGVLLAGGGCRMAPAPATATLVAEQVRLQHLAQLDSLTATLTALDDALARRVRLDSVHAHFAAARAQYKHVEALVEYYLPTTADLINGPALEEMEEDDPLNVIPAEGFQPLEELLYPGESLADSASRALARTHVGILAANLRRARDDAQYTPFTDAAVFDAARQQLMRIMVLGVSGFDSPVALRSLFEARDAMDGIAAMMRPYRSALRGRDARVADELERLMRQSRITLEAAPDFEHFDRLAFLTRDIRPLGGALLAAQTALRIPMPADPRAWRMTMPTLFERSAIDAGYFAADMRGESSQHEVELGRRLFRDPTLSKTGVRSCASCHQPSRAFTDGRRQSLPGASTSPALRRNAPTLLNGALQNAQFADLRAPFLEEQVHDVLSNAEEMHGSPAQLARTLAARPEYQAAFSLAYGKAGGVTAEHLRRALAAYLRTLTALDAPFDRFVRGDSTAMSPDAQRGFSVFMGKGKCGTCHFAPLFNGSVPPQYQKTESEVLGVPSSPVWRGAHVDADSGRARITRLATHLHAFKTPTVRNVALTAPYMHNGVYRTLEDVIEFYDRGGGAGIGARVENQTLPADPLRLTTAEKRQLIAFLHALTDTTSLSSRDR